MGGRVIGESVALELVRAFLAAKYTGEDRHQQRLGKLMAIEGRYATMPGAKKAGPGQN